MQHPRHPCQLRQRETAAKLRKGLILILFHAVFAQLPIITGPHPWLAQGHDCHLVFSDAGNFGGDLQRKTDYTWQTTKCKSRSNSSLQIFPSSRSQSEFIFTEF